MTTDTKDDAPTFEACRFVADDRFAMPMQRYDETDAEFRERVAGVVNRCSASESPGSSDR